jgi:hypothetical protein
MAARKRIVKKLPEFRLAKDQKEKEPEENDLKKVKAQTLKDLEKNKKEWFDNELDKNLKKQ